MPIDVHINLFGKVGISRLTENCN